MGWSENRRQLPNPVQSGDYSDEECRGQLKFSLRTSEPGICRLAVEVSSPAERRGQETNGVDRIALAGIVLSDKKCQMLAQRNFRLRK
jgi:hypothetical protein